MKRIAIITALITISFVHANAQSVYSNFPEKFDTDQVKNEYDDAEIALKSGTWRLKGAKLVTKGKGVDIEDDGTKALQFRSNNKSMLTAEMKFDLDQGASKVTVSSAHHGADGSCKWRLQMSVNGGKKWTNVGKIVHADNKSPREETIEVKADGKVRFRILKLDLGSPKEDPSIENGRLIIDNITIYTAK